MDHKEDEIIQVLEEVNARLRASLVRLAESFSMSVTQAHIIILIDEGITKVSGIAKKLGVTDATVSDSVRSLKLKEMVVSVENTRDNRSKILALTEYGRDVARAVVEYDAYVKQQISEMHMSEKAVLLEGLQKLLAKIKPSPFL